MRRLFWLLFFIGSGFCDTLNILYSGSSNGNLRECSACPDEPYGGLPRRKALIDSLRAQDPDLLCFDSGNLFSPFGDAFKDSIFFLGFDRIGYDAVGIGDQELIHGVDFLSLRLSKAQSQFISTNLYYQDGPLTAPYIIKEVKGIKVGAISLVDPTVFSFYPDLRSQGVSVRDPIPVLSELLPRLGPEVDLLILLSNLGDELEKKVAEEFPMIDIILSGRSRKRLDPPEQIGEVLQISPGPDGKWVGVLRVELSLRRIIGFTNELIPLSDEIPSDPEVYELTQAYFRRHPIPEPEARKAKVPSLILFYGPDCEHCDAIIYDYLPKLARRYQFTVEYRSLAEPENYRQLVELEERYGGGIEHELPVLFFADTILGGEAGIRNYLEPKLKRSTAKKEGSAAQPVKPDTEVVTTTELVYFYETGCRACDRAEYMLEALAKEFPDLKVTRFNRDEKKSLAEGFRIFYRVPEAKRLVAPSIFVGPDYLIGDDINYRRTEALIAKHRGSSIPWAELQSLIPAAETGIIERFRSLGVLGVIGAGLLDGINPCAFTTIGFFIAYLGILGLAGRKILLVGLAFILAVFAVYLGLGLGAYQFLETILRLRLVAQIVVGATSAVVLVLAGLSFYDFFKARRGEFSKLKLKLPALLKDQIHRSVRRNATLGGWILGSFITGGLVSVLELACTGQVYLPTIIFVAQFPQLRAHAISYLIIYNLCFILPLVGVFILAYLGFSSQKSQQWFARHISAVKFATGCLFLILGGFLFSSLLI